MLISDSRLQPSILWCHWLNSSRPGIQTFRYRSFWSKRDETVVICSNKFVIKQTFVSKFVKSKHQDLLHIEREHFSSFQKCLESKRNLNTRPMQKVDFETKKFCLLQTYSKQILTFVSKVRKKKHFLKFVTAFFWYRIEKEKKCFDPKNIDGLTLHLSTALFSGWTIV
jgi:hypothetical protein